MAKRLIWIAIAVAVVFGVWYWWNNRADADAVNSGGVSSHDTFGSKSAMDRGAVSGSSIDDKPGDGYGGKVSYENDPPKPLAPVNANQPTASTGSVASSGTTGFTGTVNGGSASPQSVAQAPTVMPYVSRTTDTTPTSLPVTDTLSPNAPNGMAFGGSGKFQWYRQGAITWRINTQSGEQCIAFATMEEWQKPIVYTHGCGNA